MWGIYGKILFLCPAYHKKEDLEGPFFHICPAAGEKCKFLWILELMWGTGEEFFCICPAQLCEQRNYLDFEIHEFVHMDENMGELMLKEIWRLAKEQVYSAISEVMNARYPSLQNR